MIELLKLESISKDFPGVKALDGVDFVLKSGEVHALIGENGAGKSTLIKILMGVYQKDKGHIVIEGREVSINNPIDAKELGLAAVYQEVMLAPHLSIGENFFLGKLPMKNGFVDWNMVYSKTSEVLKEIGLNVNPRIKIRDIPVSQQEMVSIAKMIFENVKIIIFDEPTALLTTEETDRLFSIIDNLKKKGVGIIYISHRLEEIFNICDTVTVLRDGQRIETKPIADVTVDMLISFMVGRNLDAFLSINHPEKGEEVLRVESLSREPAFRDVSFSVKKGEVFGMFGLLGSGRTDIVRCIFGADKKHGGDVYLNGEVCEIRTPLSAIQKGIGLLPENRRTQGLAYQLSVLKNINLNATPPTLTLGFIKSKKEQEIASNYINELSIKTPSMHQLVKNLSGGNQQKTVIAKLLNAHSKIFILDEPTVGVDVGAKQEIYKLIENLIQEGASIILISSYLPEIMGLADRILVMCEGKCMGIAKNTGDISEEKLLKMASGLVENNEV